jgi:hypothetical protein
VCSCLFSLFPPKSVISTEGGALCRRNGEICCSQLQLQLQLRCAVAGHFDRRRRILPPQWRNLLFARFDTN